MSTEAADAVDAPPPTALRSDVRLPANVDRGIFITRLSSNFPAAAVPQPTQPIGDMS